MAARNYSNTAVVTTIGSLTNVATTGTLAAATGWPTAPCTAVIEPGTSNAEVVLITARSGTSITAMTRGYDGTTNVAHSASSVIAHEIPAIDPAEANAHVNASAAVHGLAGTVVGTTDTQTLTNKTFAAGSNTFTGLATASGTYSVSGTGGGTGTATLVSQSVTVPSPCALAKLTLHLTEIGPNEGVITWTLAGTGFAGNAARHIHHVSGSTINATYTTWLASPTTGSQTLAISLSSQATASTCSGAWLLEFSN